MRGLWPPFRDKEVNSAVRVISRMGNGLLRELRLFYLYGLQQTACVDYLFFVIISNCQKITSARIIEEPSEASKNGSTR